MSDREISITEAQALAFRARRHHLLGPGAEDPAAAARAVLGIQAQVLAPALWSLAMRCAGRPPASVCEDLLEGSPELVRTWGQRGTVHIFDAPAHWACAVAAFRHWTIGARPGPQPDEHTIAAAAARIRELARPVTRSDLFDLIPGESLALMVERVGPGTPALRGAAGRVIWALCRRGDLSIHTTVDGEQSYILRGDRYPDLEWSEPSEREAGLMLVRGYLAANAPATVQDVAHFLGCRVAQARRQLEALDAEIVAVACGGRGGLLALAADAADLARRPPSAWRPRLLPKFDTMLMAHRDKSWTVPDADDRPRIWAKAAQVNATVLDRGRLVGTWRHTALKRSVKVEITPLSGWVDGLERALAKEAGEFALHLGRPGAEVHLAAV
jgi:hypothetical protein